jgi:hypothetical protein
LKNISIGKLAVNLILTCKLLIVSASVASRISKLWGIVPHSTEKCGGFEKNVGDIHLPYTMTYRKEFIYFTFRHF